MVYLAPTSTIENVLISIVRAPRATNASSLASLMCASGSTIFRNSQWRIQNSALQAPARQLRDSWDAIRLAPTSPSFRTTLQLDNASVYLQNTSFINFRSFFGNVTIPLRFPSTNNNVALALSPLHLAVFSCASNFWDNAPLIKYTNQLLWPTTADSSTANYSLLTMHVDEGSDWCTLPPSSAPTPIPTSTTYSDLMAMTHRSSVATTAVLSASLLSTSSVGASVVPRLQGIVGTFRIAARCQLASGASSQSNDEEVSSGYVANDVLDNPLMLHLVPVAPSLAYAVGALIGNTLLFIAVGVVSHLLGVAKHHAIKTVKGVRNGRRDLLGADTMRVQNRKRVLGESDDRTSLNRYSAEMFLVASEVLPTVPLPASLMLLYGLLQEPTMVAALASVAYHERDAVSVVVGVVMGLCWIALPYVFLWLLLVKHAPLPLQTISAGRVHSKRLRWQRSGRALEWLCAERERWVVGSGRRSTTRDTARQVNRRLGALVRGVSYRRRWYFGIDALLGGLTGIVIGAAESVPNGDACDAAVWGTACVGAIGAASCVLCVWLRPFVVRVELFSAFVVSFLSVIASVLMLAGDANSAGVVSLLASAVPLVSIVAGYAWRACCLPHDAEQRANAGAATSRGNERTTQKLSLGQMEALKGLLECICNSA